MTLALLAHADDEIQEYMYKECLKLVSAVLGIHYTSQHSWKNIIFLLKSDVLTEIICHGATSSNEAVRTFFMLKFSSLNFILKKVNFI